MTATGSARVMTIPSWQEYNEGVKQYVERFNPGLRMTGNARIPASSQSHAVRTT